jgi:hypothetical protein
MRLEAADEVCSSESVGGVLLREEVKDEDDH